MVPVHSRKLTSLYQGGGVVLVMGLSPCVTRLLG